MSQEELKEKTRFILEEVAASGDTIRYGELAGELNKALNRTDIEANSTFLMRVLDDLSLEDHAKGKGMLSVVVVRENGGIPGAGFFSLADAQGLFENVSGESEASKNDRVFKSELAKVYRAYGV